MYIDVELGADIRELALPLSLSVLGNTLIINVLCFYMIIRFPREAY
jgi:hypothetical protein